MTNETLRILSGSGYVNLPKRELRKDGLVEDDEVVEDQEYKVEKMGHRAYLVRLPEDEEELPPLEETEVVQQQVALEMQELYRMAFVQSPPTPGAD
jgi:hypothetical protein